MWKEREIKAQKQEKSRPVKATAFHFKIAASLRSSCIATEYNISTAVPAFPCIRNYFTFNSDYRAAITLVAEECVLMKSEGQVSSTTAFGKSRE